jgi:ATP-dependent DNA helicase RecG
VRGKGIGLEKISFLMKNNGNPAVVFETDKKRKYFKVFLPIHPKFVPQDPILEIQPKPLKGIHEIVLSLSQVCPKHIDVKNAALLLLTAQEPVSLEDLMFKLNQTNKSRFRKSFIKPLMSLGLLEYTISQKPRSGKQKYVITEQGRALVEKEGSS